MIRTRRARSFIVAALLIVLWVVGIGATGYFLGIKGVALGWPAFWTMAAVAIGMVWLVIIGVALLEVLLRWIERGERP